ncbi:MULTISPECIES: roadblock/LC7 domain-containing protein [Streptomyces]|uniref:Roadblock/LC7 domain-containing protein n=1 Tax=Streptomyces aidingensis TaxID=910347 RepID=A0A1I1U3E5_9ACTN|nr:MULTISPECIES: roadblock/LC7 domain-containing protein [Streptomyces]SFD65299.1 Roadblock/LC7 domain-containing protein [Streptomyces aidingensis]
MTELRRPTADTTDMTWALDQLGEEREVVHALLFTSDGMVLAASKGLERADAERTAAAFSGIKALQADLAGFCGVQNTALPLRHLVTDLKDHTVLLFAAGQHTGLAVSVRGDSTSRQTGVAITSALKMIAALRPALEAHERKGSATAQPGSPTGAADTPA